MPNHYAEPRDVTNLEDCYFYHTMDLADHGTVDGEWDLRPGMEEYFGHTSFAGKRVLEVGTASGFCCFWMESRGAQVVAYDLSPNESWDVVPFARIDHRKILADRKEHIRKLNNAYWYGHRVLGSKAKVVYGSVYDIPAAIGPFDVSTFCLVLPHVRDPFLALQNALQMTRETVVIVGSPQKKWTKRLLLKILRRYLRPGMFLWPDASSGAPWDTWWMIPEETARSFIEILGFGNVKINYHYQKTTNDGKRLLYTMVGQRLSGEPLLGAAG